MKYQETFGVVPPIKLLKGWYLLLPLIDPHDQAAYRLIISNGRGVVSVYYDNDQSLGLFDGQPYFEIYPTSSNDCERFGVDEIPRMIQRIKVAINSKPAKAKRPQWEKTK